MHDYLDRYCKTRGATRVVRVNFILAQAGAKIKRAEGHFGNLKTMLIAVSQPNTGKSPSIRCAIDDPMKSLPAIQELIRTSITAGGFSKALADKCPSISSTICTKLFSIDQFYCRLKNGIYPSKLKQTAIEMNKLIQICWICSTD